MEIVRDCDVQGRKYLKLTDAKEGMVELDAGFTCRKAGPVMLFRSEKGFYFFCDDGIHYISGQADDGIHCIGIYP